MKIGPLDPKLNSVGTTGAERRTNGASAAKSVTEPSAKVELSSAGATSASAADDVSFDKAKVDRIATAIREGRFEVNAGAIADKLIANAQEVIGRLGN